jgi:hypothetical protein
MSVGFADATEEIANEEYGKKERETAESKNAK